MNKSLAAGMIIIAAGTKSRLDEAMALWYDQGRFVMIGERPSVGSAGGSVGLAFSDTV